VNPAELREIFERYGAISSGHFKLSSGRHSDTYVQCARVLQHPRLTFSLADRLAECFRGQVDVVVSPALGGILIGYAVAHSLACRFVFAERVEGSFALRRGHQVERGERALVVEDVITTGGSAAQVLELARRSGAAAAGVAALVDRSEQAPRFHLEALLRVDARSWDPSDCPLCVAGTPLDAPGSRFLGTPRA
jgi:orotate phosphoribosyltransferase